MGLFNFGKADSPQPAPGPGNHIPITQIDLSRRYDVYFVVSSEERLYENVRFIGIRTFERLTEYSVGIGGFLEVEVADGTRILIPHYGIQLMCEHGAKPVYKILRTWGRRVGPA
jgi:hypothetical protein